MRDKINFSFSDICNPDDAIFYSDGSNPHNVRPFLLHDHGFVLAVAFAECLQDALDEAADRGKLDQFLIAEEYYGELLGVDYLGNYGKPYDIQCVDVVEMSNAEFIKQLSAAKFEA